MSDLALDDLALDARTGLWLPSTLAEPRRCRFCHCTDAMPCMDDGVPCGWAEPDLCTGCDAELADGTCQHGFIGSCAVCDGAGQVPEADHDQAEPPRCAHGYIGCCPKCDGGCTRDVVDGV